MAPVSLEVVAWVGGLTAGFAATIGLVQTDIKRVLAYSTISQLGYMFVGGGGGGHAGGRPRPKRGPRSVPPSPPPACSCRFSTLPVSCSWPSSAPRACRRRRRATST